MTHPPIKAPFELPQTEAAADWYEAGKAAHTAWRASVVDEMQGPEWDALTLTEHLQWMSAAEDACATLSHPATQAGAVQAVREAAQAAFDAYRPKYAGRFGILDDGPIDKEMTALKDALAATQPSAAPVAVVEPIGDGQGEAMLLKALPIGTLLYAAPGQGWQSVPVTPTEEMELAGCVPAGSIGEARETWKAMLAAAPASAAPEDGQGAAEITGYRWRYIDHKGLTQNHWSYTPDDPREWRSWASGTEPQWGVNAECIAMVDAAPGAAIAAREQEAPRTLRGEVWDDNPDGIVPGQERGPRMNSDTGFYEE